MKKLIELAERIRDEELRKKVIAFLRRPKLSHPGFKKYPGMKIEKATSLFTVSTPEGVFTVEREVFNHTLALVNLCEKVAPIVQERYGIPINLDHLIAAALLHDLMKMFEWKKEGSVIEHTGVKLDHTMLGVAELYRRGFPEEVIHIIAAHFGPSGPTPPRTFEALIFYYLDSMLSMTEYHLHAQARPPSQVPLILVDERALRELAKKKEK